MTTVLPLTIASAPMPIFASAAMRAVLEGADDVAQASTTVLLMGESGTGKEVLARYIHRHSPRSEGPWVAVNCAALPADLLESELFGHEKGAFTGAAERRIGKIEQAHTGTLLLDEISELPLGLQAKLLRALQEREVDRVGGTKPQPVDVRIIATCNRDLAEMVKNRQFRADLYYRLCVFPMVLPPLRERSEDIPLLAAHLLDRLAISMGRPAPLLSTRALSALVRHDFPGNVRELANFLERALVRCRDGILDLEHLDPELSRRIVMPVAAAHPAPQVAVQTAVPSADELPDGLPLEIEALERLAIAKALRRSSGNRTHAARLLGISLRTLRNKLRALREGGTLWAAEVAA